MKKVFALLLPLFIFLTFALPSYAQEENLLRTYDCTYSPGGGLGKVVTLDCVVPLFANAIYWLIILSGTVAVFLIIFGGIKFLTSGGDQNKVEGAKKTITWSIVGLVLVLSSFMIVNVLADITGVNCITRFGFTACGNEIKTKCGGENYGYCENSRLVCLKISRTSYDCRLPCNKDTKKNGNCNFPATCQEISSGVWNCKTGL